MSQNLKLILSFKTALFFYNNFIHSYGIHLYYSMTMTIYIYLYLLLTNNVGSYINSL